MKVKIVYEKVTFIVEPEKNLRKEFITVGSPSGCANR